MNTSQDITAIAPALVKAQGQMGVAIKDSTNPHFKSKYADLAAVIDAIKKPFFDNGLAFIQATEPADGNEVRVTTTIIHSSGQWISSTTQIPVTKADAQGFGSALTYAKRYGLQALAGLPSDDDDGNAAVQAAPAKIVIPRDVQKAVYEQSISCLAGADAYGLHEIWAPFNTDEKAALWGMFNSQQRSAMKELQKEVKNG